MGPGELRVSCTGLENLESYAVDRCQGPVHTTPSRYNKALTEDNNKQTRNALREAERAKAGDDLDRCIRCSRQSPDLDMSWYDLTLYVFHFLSKEKFEKARYVDPQKAEEHREKGLQNPSERYGSMNSSSLGRKLLEVAANVTRCERQYVLQSKWHGCSEAGQSHNPFAPLQADLGQLKRPREL